MRTTVARQSAACRWRVRRSLRLAPSMAYPIGSPRPSAATDHFQPHLLRSVGFGPVPSPPGSWASISTTWPSMNRSTRPPTRQVSDTTLRARRDEWIDAGVFEKLKDEALAAFDRASPKAAVAFRWTRLLSYDMQLLTFDMPAATLRLDQK